jgi:CheY-like chemotaxis protein
VSFAPEVLLALADEATQAFYATSLESSGFRVITAPSTDALALARRRRPAVVVIDTSRDGDVATCRDFKADPALRSIPIVALAPPGDRSPSDRACDAVLPVECLPHVLVEAIDRLLTKHTRNG